MDIEHQVIGVETGTLVIGDPCHLYQYFQGKTWEQVADGMPGDHMKAVQFGTTQFAYIGVQDDGPYKLDAVYSEDGDFKYIIVH